MQSSSRIQACGHTDVLCTAQCAAMSYPAASCLEPAALTQQALTRQCAGTVLSGWRVFPLQLDAPAAVQFAALPNVSAPSAAESGPVFYRRAPRPPSGLTALPTSCSQRSRCHACIAARVLPLAFISRLSKCWSGQQHSADCASRARAPRSWHRRLGERTGEGARARRGTLRINGSEAGTNAEGTLPDTCLDMRGWGKGLLWVNGNNLGWFWASAGPQARPAGRRRFPAPPAPGAHALRASERAQLCSTRPCECSSKAAVTAAMIKR